MCGGYFSLHFGEYKKKKHALQHLYEEENGKLSGETQKANTYYILQEYTLNCFMNRMIGGRWWLSRARFEFIAANKLIYIFISV